MNEEISNGILIGHIQAMKNDLQQQIAKLDHKITRLDERVRQGFDEAREHRQALQEDLEATIRMVGKHEKKLATM